MKDKFFFVSYNYYPVLVILIGYWYKKSGVLNRVTDIASRVPDVKLAENYSEHIIGGLVCEEGGLYDEFIRFYESLDYGQFLMEQKELDWNIRQTAYSRIRQDVGLVLKGSDWFRNRKPILDEAKESLRVMKRIMNS
jgi:hypothetical protein